MPLEAIYAKLTEILRDVFDDDDVVARPDLTADDVERWDSYAHIRIMLAAEHAFGVEFTGAEIASLANVGDLALLVAAKLPV